MLLTVINPNTLLPYKMRALFDRGSNDMYITETFAKRLRLTLGRSRMISIGIFENIQPMKICTASTEFILTNNQGFKLTVQTDTMPELPRTYQYFDYTDFQKSYQQYANLEFIEQALAEPFDLIIGNDYFN